MIGIPPKVKENLALLYDYPEFKALEKWSEVKRAQVAEELLKVTMGAPGSSERIAMLQGQAYAHEVMLKEIRKIHKDITNNESWFRTSGAHPL